MLYLIGGASRAGKTATAQLLRQAGIASFSVDYLTHALQYGAPHLGISHDTFILDRAERLWPFVRPMLEFIADAEPDYVVEGHSLLPVQVAFLSTRLGRKMKSCFLGYPGLTPQTKSDFIRKYPAEVNDWLRNCSDTVVLDTATDGVEFSRYLQSECTKYTLPFFDTSSDFRRTISEACDFLVPARRSRSGAES